MSKFQLHIIKTYDNSVVDIASLPATSEDLRRTTELPEWQTDWTSDYITQSGFDLYAFKTAEDELVALGAYEIGNGNVGIHIVYMESQAESNPTLVENVKYRGIGKAIIAYGIKLSADAGFNGDVTLDAKTPELAAHYERDYHALRLPGRDASTAPRYLICDEAALDIFTSYLVEE